MLIAEGWYTVFQMPQIAVVMGCLIPIAAAIGSFWYKGQKVRSENNLKQSMVERGMSAEEIERVMSSSPKRDRGIDNTAMGTRIIINGSSTPVMLMPPRSVRLIPAEAVAHALQRPARIPNSCVSLTQRVHIGG